MATNIEGCIGVGKTTYCSKVRSSFYTEMIVPELLDAFYKNPKDLALTMECVQMFNSINLVKEVNLKKETDTCLIDRGPLGNYAFAILMKIDELLSETEWEIFNGVLRETKFVDIALSFKRLIVLWADTEICMERIKMRGRKSEEMISETYLRKLNQINFHLFVLVSNLTKRVQFLNWNSFGDCSVDYSPSVFDSGEEIDLSVFKSNTLFGDAKLPKLLGFGEFYEISEEGIKFVLDKIFSGEKIKIKY
jgi:deoxyadenosine/deoxycytidine kinase